MKILSLILLVGFMICGNLYAGTGYYYDNCPGCSGSSHHTYNIPTPTPSPPPAQSGDSNRNCHTEEYVCGQTCFNGSYDGDRSRQGLGYCIDKICTRTVCD